LVAVVEVAAGLLGGRAERLVGEVGEGAGAPLNDDPPMIYSVV